MCLSVLWHGWYLTLLKLFYVLFPLPYFFLFLYCWEGQWNIPISYGLTSIEVGWNTVRIFGAGYVQRAMEYRVLIWWIGSYWESEPMKIRKLNGLHSQPMLNRFAKENPTLRRASSLHRIQQRRRWWSLVD